MGKWIHRLTDLNLENEIANCENCGIVRIINKPRNNGKRGWICQKAKQKRNRESAKNSGNQYSYKRKYRKHVKNKCIRCGFIPEDICQLDVDHIDGNHKNNNLDNLQTLCSNCHRLKTKLNKEGPYKNTPLRKTKQGTIMP